MVHPDFSPNRSGRFRFRFPICPTVIEELGGKSPLRVRGVHRTNSLSLKPSPPRGYDDNVYDLSLR